MNVRLLLSESVKVALLWLHRDIKENDSDQADATAEFCGTFNEITSAVHKV